MAGPNVVGEAVAQHRRQRRAVVHHDDGVIVEPRRDRVGKPDDFRLHQRRLIGLHGRLKETAAFEGAGAGGGWPSMISTGMC